MRTEKILSHIGHSVHYNAREKAHNRQEGSAYRKRKGACAVHVFPFQFVIFLLHGAVRVFFKK